MFPWRLAQLLTGILQYLNVALIAYTILKIADVNNPDIIGSTLGFLYPIILIINNIEFSSKKYCTRRVKYGLVWDEKYCTLKDKYDAMFKEQRIKYKRTFFVYCISTVLISAITIKVFIL